MGVASLSLRSKILASVVAVGSTAAVAGLGTYSSFSTTTSVDSATSTGQLSIAAGATDSLSSGVSGMLAGDSHEMLFDLTNASDGIGSYQLSAASNAPSSVLTAAGGLQVAVDMCSNPWTANADGVTYSCTGTQTPLLTVTDVHNLATAQSLAGLDPTNGAINRLRFTLSLPDVGDSFQGQSETITWTFAAYQRPGQAI